MKILPWNQDKWDSRQGSVLSWDKLEHFIRDFVILLALLIVFGFSPWVFAVWAAWIILYEVKDGIVPYDGKHIQGFSIKDALAGFIGGFFAVIVYVIAGSLL